MQRFKRYLLEQEAANIDEYSQTQRYDNMSQIKPKTFSEPNTQFKKSAAVQRYTSGKTRNKEFVYASTAKAGKNKDAAHISKLVKGNNKMDAVTKKLRDRTIKNTKRNYEASKEIAKEDGTYDKWKQHNHGSHEHFNRFKTKLI